MPIFDCYMIKNLAIATVFITVTLSVVILLTQSLRFLELVIEAGASSGAFWVLTLLALPRFFEVILPLALLCAVLFIYSRMTADSELVVMRSTGASPLALARPAIVLGLVVTVFLMGITLWGAPKSLRTMQEMRQEVKAQFSTLLFREGVFNQIGSGLTLYIRDKSDDGELLGIMIYDSREENKKPSMIIAKRGVLSQTDDGYEVFVYDGSRQEFDHSKKIFNRLNFERYVIDLPNSDPVRQRWKEPDERTVFELFDPDLANIRDVESLGEFQLEVHRRILSPLLALAFTVVGCMALLIGPLSRRGQVGRIIAAVVAIVALQGLYLTCYNLAKQTHVGLLCMYILVFAPLGGGLFMLSHWSEGLRRRVLYSGMLYGGVKRNGEAST